MIMSDDENIDVGLATKAIPKTKKPKMYKVMLLNDDYTPMEFVVHILERYFGTSGSQAYELMMVVHIVQKELLEQLYLLIRLPI